MVAHDQRIWLSSYPENIPHDIDIDEFSSIADILESSCKRYSEQNAFTCMGKSLRFADLESLSSHFAAYLQSQGLTAGDRIALMMPNMLQYPVALFGALRAGLVIVNTNPLYTPRELQYQLHDSGAVAIVILENFAHVLEEVIAHTAVRLVVTTQLGDMLGFPKSLIVNAVVRHVKKLIPAWHLGVSVRFNAALKAGAALPFQKPALTHDDLAFLQYTGGTTGVPKGAMLTHGNIVANLLQARYWLAPFLTLGQEVILTALPLYHIFSLTANCLTFMAIGGENILISNPRDIKQFIREMSKIKFTAITAVNTLFNALLNHPDFEKLDFSSLKMALGGGMAVQRAVADRWQTLTGKPLVEAYGLTETSPAACINPLTVAGFNGKIGLPIPSTIVTIRNDAGEQLPIGEAGEICIAGPQVMRGYWQKPEETAKVMTIDGAFKTGDIGFMDDAGFVKIVDRKKDMILVSGFNVYPNEIEDVIALCPGVLEVCAVAAPDEHSGEVVRVVIVKKDLSLSKEKIQQHCQQALTAYKRPKMIEFWDALPKTNVGKVLRREVRDSLKHE